MSTTSKTIRRTVLRAIPAAAVTTMAPVAATALNASHVDYTAALARLEQVVETLRTCNVSDGFQLDEKGAARAIAYLRKLATTGADDSEADDAEWSATLDFIYGHGQSLDWVIIGDPRCMVRTLASYGDGVCRAGEEM